MSDLLRETEEWIRGDCGIKGPLTPEVSAKLTVLALSLGSLEIDDGETGTVGDETWHRLAPTFRD